jgi:signal transduction histidine kinase
MIAVRHWPARLAALWSGTGRDAPASEHRRAEAEMRWRAEELVGLAHHLQLAREDERRRLARDLHDELGSLLTSAKLDIARIRPRLANESHEVRERLSHLVATLDSVIAVKRRVIEDLHPSALTHLGLEAALEILTREFGRSSGTTMHVELGPVQADPDAALVIYRVVQEALTNISKHAQARQVWVTLDREGAGLAVSVRDDGIGFDPHKSAGSVHGLLGMRFRVEAEGGRLELSTAPGRGTLILAVLPVSA